jgi:hypothetical protein
MNIANLHPADELGAIRDAIKQLEAREAVLRAYLLDASNEERDGVNFTAFVQASVRETLDKPALIAAFGRDAIEPYIKASEVRSLKLARRSDED